MNDPATLNGGPGPVVLDVPFDKIKAPHRSQR